MKKNEFIYPTVFLAMVLLLFTIPLGAFLTSEIIGFDMTRSIGGWIYKFLRDQGSLIAGTLAVLTAFFTIRFERRQFKKNVLERDRRESLELLFQTQEDSLFLARYLELGRDKGTSSGGEITEEEIDEMAPLSREILRRTIIIKSYLEDSGREEAVLLVDIIIKQSNLFNNYLNYMRVVDGVTLYPAQVTRLNLEVSEIIEGQSDADIYEKLYPDGLEFKEVKLHRCYRTHLSKAWGCISNDISGRLITALLKK